MTKHNFNVGDRIALTDHHTTVGSYTVDYYVKNIDGDCYILRKANSNDIRVGAYYPYMKKIN